HNLTVVNYSDKAIAVIGETYPVKEILKRIGGRFNYNLTCGAGWIFSKAKAELLRKELNLNFVL
ncbi:MAG TPA: fusion protein, partial [Bacteroidia bacterium]|nr:fusion protein [Bacteroidia bacterium]